MNDTLETRRLRYQNLCNALEHYFSGDYIFDAPNSNIAFLEELLEDFRGFCGNLLNTLEEYDPL